MVIGRVIGWLLLLAAAVVFMRDLIGWYDTGVFAPTAAGQLWFDIDRSSLNLVQAVIQRYISAWLWQPVIATILLGWAVLVIGGPGLLLVWACRRRNRRRRQH